MQSSACNVVSQRFNMDLSMWEIRIATHCGPRVAVGKDYDKTMQLAARESTDPRRPTLVRLV